MDTLEHCVTVGVCTIGVGSNHCQNGAWLSRQDPFHNLPPSAQAMSGYLAEESDLAESGNRTYGR